MTFANDLEHTYPKGLHHARAPTIFKYIDDLKQELANSKEFFPYITKTEFHSLGIKKPFKFTNSEYLNRMVYQHNTKYGDKTFTIKFEELQIMVMKGIENLDLYIHKLFEEYKVIRFEYIQNKYFKYLYLFNNIESSEIHVIDFHSAEDLSMSIKELFTLLVGYIVKYSESDKTTKNSKIKSAI